MRLSVPLTYKMTTTTTTDPVRRSTQTMDGSRMDPNARIHDWLNSSRTSFSRTSSTDSATSSSSLRSSDASPPGTSDSSLPSRPGLRPHLSSSSTSPMAYDHFKRRLSTVHLMQTKSSDHYYNLNLCTPFPRMVGCLRKLFGTRRFRSILLICLLLSIAAIILLSDLCPGNKPCASSKRPSHFSWSRFHRPPILGWIRRDTLRDNLSIYQSAIAVARSREESGSYVSYEQLATRSTHFNITADDVIVFLHIQKTGGTVFGKHLVRDLDLQRPCECRRGRKRCRCFRPQVTTDQRSQLTASPAPSPSAAAIGGRNRNWLFSRYSTGWRCGLHADWTELTHCVDSALAERGGGGEDRRRRYFYITLLRNPVNRFISEWLHVRRGATWRGSLHWCGGRQATADELPLCYPEDGDWSDVPLDEFVGCPHNLAKNRMSRMLAELALVNCYNTTAMAPERREALILESAKINLSKMAFFGLLEELEATRNLFESAFGLHFLRPFVQFNETHSSLSLNGITQDQLARIREANKLDIQLYDYAKELLAERLKKYKREEEQEEEHQENVPIDSHQIETVAGGVGGPSIGGPRQPLGPRRQPTSHDMANESTNTQQIEHNKNLHNNNNYDNDHSDRNLNNNEHPSPREEVANKKVAESDKSFTATLPNDPYLDYLFNANVDAL